MKFEKLKTQLPENKVTLLLTRTAPVRDKSTDAVIRPGRVLPNEENVRTILRYDPRLTDSIESVSYTHLTLPTILLV